MKSTVIEMVKEFHETYGHPVGPELPTQLRQYERLTYINEEMNELLTAIINDDEVEVIDALGDLMYFVNGTLVEFGLSATPQAKLEQINEILPGEDLGTDLMLGYMNLHAMTGQILACAIADADKKCLAHLSLMHAFIVEMFKRMGIDYYPVLEEIHRSNMSKLWVDDEEVTAQCLHEMGLNKDQVNFASHSSGRLVVTRVDNGKVLKGMDYSKPQLEQFV